MGARSVNSVADGSAMLTLNILPEPMEPQMPRFKEMISRLTGIGTPIFGASCNPPEAERAVARRVLAFLEDRRVLYNPTEMEVPDQCAQSVMQIRSLLSSELGALDTKSQLAGSLRAMRTACRKFLDAVSADDRILRFGSSPGHFATWQFNGAIGELRGVVGIHVALLSACYGLDVEEPLASILPAADEGRE